MSFLFFYKLIYEISFDPNVNIEKKLLSWIITHFYTKTNGTISDQNNG